MRALFFKELKDNRFLVLAVLALLAAVSALPGQFGRAWTGMSAFLLIPVLCSHFGARLLHSETEDQQLEMLLTLPVSRARIWWAKTAASLLLTVFLTLLAMAAQVCRDKYAMRNADAATFLASILALHALAGFFSMVLQRGQAATFAAVGAFVVGLTTVAQIRDTFLGGRRYDRESLALFVATNVVIALAASYYTFTRADLLDERDRRRTALKVAFVGLAASLACFLLICL